MGRPKRQYGSSSPTSIELSHKTFIMKIQVMSITSVIPKTPGRKGTNIFLSYTYIIRIFVINRANSNTYTACPFLQTFFKTVILDILFDNKQE